MYLRRLRIGTLQAQASIHHYGHQMDLKALGYGLAAFLGGWALMTVVAGAMATSGGYASANVLIQVLGYLVPVVAGFVAAKKATQRRIAHGIAGGAIGVVPIILLPMLLVPGYSPSGSL